MLHLYVDENDETIITFKKPYGGIRPLSLSQVYCEINWGTELFLFTLCPDNNNKLERKNSEVHMFAIILMFSARIILL